MNLKLAFALLLALEGCIFFPSNRPSHAQIAGELRGEGKFDEAIAEYRAHIADRVASPDRAADENPSFYLVLIGDIELERGNREAAKAAYAAARNDKVGKELVGDRYRLLAESYAKAHHFEEGIAVLKEGRDLDPLLFDIAIDDLHKRSLQEEDEASHPNN